MRYFLGGINGAGKTTLLEKIKVRFPEIEIIKGSTAFMEYLGIPGDYTALRALPLDEANKKLEDLINKLLTEKDSFIFDAHYLNLVEGKVKRVYEDWIQKFDAVILLDVSAKTALERMSRDKRDRALFSAGLTYEEQLQMYDIYSLANKQEFESVVKVRNIPHLVINGENSIDKEVEEFAEFYKYQKFGSI